MSKIFVMERSKRSIEYLSTDSDSFLLFLYISAQMTIFPFSWLLALIGSSVLHVVIDVIWLVRLRQNKYRRLPKENVPQSIEVLTRRLGMPSSPAIFVDTTQLTCSAKVIPYMLGGAILMSSGLLMKAASGDERAEGVIAHELAHIENGDYALFRFATLIFIAPFANVIALASQATDKLVISMLGVAVAMYVYKAFLRRRELYADARAMNAMLSRDSYLSYFKNEEVPGEESATHPSCSRRLHSLETECAVSKPSAFIIFMSLLVALAVSKKAFEWTGSVALTISAFFAHLLIPISMELTKPGSNMIPMTFTEWREAIELGKSASEVARSVVPIQSTEAEIGNQSR